MGTWCGLNGKLERAGAACNVAAVGTVLLEIWCFYFLPVGVMSWRYFGREDEHE